jgi:hypothetical protein
LISHPRLGQRVQVWYAARHLPLPHHGAVGVVEIAGKGRPRNHGVRIGGVLVVVPAGNLRNPK